MEETAAGNKTIPDANMLSQQTFWGPQDQRVSGSSLRLNYRYLCESSLRCSSEYNKQESLFLTDCGINSTDLQGGVPMRTAWTAFSFMGGGMRGAHKMKRQRHFLFQKPVWCHAASAGALVSHIQPIQTELCCQRRQAVIQADGEDKISFHFIIPNIKKSLGGMAAGGGHGGENKPNQEGGISFHLLNMRIILELTLSFNQNSDEQPPSSELKTAHLNIYLLLRLQSRTDSRKITEIQH